jgi:hypothetical protein
MVLLEMANDFQDIACLAVSDLASKALCRE